ncbi:response regulator transcription factor [Hydrogenimonas sp. SS33]|uniref:response regulator transcription factor n=1 Tax=Hydrogenimonas leucolamina TaxID=2954236 RepID=UPI00336BB663
MHLELFAHDLALLRRWEKALADLNPAAVEQLNTENSPKTVVADFSGAAPEIPAFLSSGQNREDVRMIVLESHPTYENAKRLLALGVKGYGNSLMQPVHLRACVETVMEGNVWLYPEFVSRLVADMAGKEKQSKPLPDVLTSREKELAALLLEGYGNREIGEKLGITERTVKAHLGKIFKKLHVSNRLELVTMLK